MSPFRFPLEKVLAWRRSELGLAEVRFKGEVAALAELDGRRAALEGAAIQAEAQVRAWNPVTGGDLSAIGEYRLQVKLDAQELARERAERLKTLAAREAAMLEARRRCRLLERLKEKRLEEWRVEENRGMEELASESYLAGWNMRRARAGRTSI